MNDSARRIPLTGLIAGGLVSLGVLLWMFVHPGLLIVAALGAFAPGVLRELDLLTDHDEFQRQAAHRAGYHAYLVGGMTAAVVLAGYAWWTPDLEAAGEWMRFVVLVLWLSWLFSALLAYWGAPRTTAILLRTVGAFWAVFVIADLIGEGVSLPGVGAALLFAGPFFVLAWLAGRRPQLTGALLLLVSAVLLVILGGGGTMRWSTIIMTRTLLVGPMIATGVALLRERAEGVSAPA